MQKVRYFTPTEMMNVFITFLSVLFIHFLTLKDFFRRFYIYGAERSRRREGGKRSSEPAGVRATHVAEIETIQTEVWLE